MLFAVLATRGKVLCLKYSVLQRCKQVALFPVRSEVGLLREYWTDSAKLILAPLRVEPSTPNVAEQHVCAGFGSTVQVSAYTRERRGGEARGTDSSSPDVGKKGEIRTTRAILKARTLVLVMFRQS